MRRRTFDALVSTGGLLMAVVLIVAGGLMIWGHSFVNGQVSGQLTAQKIVFPATGSPALKTLPPADAAAMSAYAGQLMTSGAQAQTYADQFIAVHLKEIGGGETYSQLSAESLANPKDTALAGQVQTVFRGETLRGLLLNAYAFWKMGQILLIAAICAFVAGGLMLILSALGLAHWRRATPEAELFGKSARCAGQQPASR
ncbi:MAG: hypothetical protein ACRDNZ_00400 [Streptosporangiaceae bacterium]